jgi:hypothetical protein
MFAAKDRKQQPGKLASASKSRSKAPSDLQKQPLDSLQLLRRSVGNQYLQALSQTVGEPDGLFMQQKDDRRMQPIEEEEKKNGNPRDLVIIESLRIEKPVYLKVPDESHFFYFLWDFYKNMDIRFELNVPMRQQDFEPYLEYAMMGIKRWLYIHEKVSVGGVDYRYEKGTKRPKYRLVIELKPISV